MSDPAIEAAQRVLDSVGEFGPVGKVGEAMVHAAAREALKPMRALHVPLFVEAQDATGRDMEVCAVCRNECGYRVEWPCDTAELIYSAAELARDFNPKWKLSQGSWTLP